MTEPAAAQPSLLDTTVAHSARLWNYLLGGKDHFAVDRRTGDKLLAFLPEIGLSVRATREFLGRATRFLAADEGIRQFLDVGTGLPTADNTHEVAQSIAPASKIVYVDNDPMVIAHARALLTSTVDGVTAFLDLDLRHPDQILDAADQVLDLKVPVAVMLIGVLDFIVDDDEAHAVVRRVIAGIPSGSYVVIAHPTWEVKPDELNRAIDLWNSHGCDPICARTPEAIATFFEGLELLAPGVVSCSQWRPTTADAAVVTDFCGVGRKP